MKSVRVLVNPRSGLGGGLGPTLQAIESAWRDEGCEVTYQFSHDPADGRAKVRRALRDDVDVVLVVGGDGMVNTIGAELVGTDVALGVIPTGSGNGFARHFGIPLTPGKAAAALRDADRCAIDVGFANRRPFFVTCSMAADAAVARAFERSPVRGILPYVFAAAYELFEYVPQPFHVNVDGGEDLTFKDPLIFTIANLTEFGGGAKIAPQACADDGFLELVVVGRPDAARAMAGIGRLFDGTIDRVPGVVTRRFRRLEVRRRKVGDIQVDGELVEGLSDVIVSVKERALTVLVPRAAKVV
jgi:diacylglycerol kinase family enzyme